MLSSDVPHFLVRGSASTRMNNAHLTGYVTATFPPGKTGLRKAMVIGHFAIAARCLDSAAPCYASCRGCRRSRDAHDPDCARSRSNRLPHTYALRRSSDAALGKAFSWPLRQYGGFQARQTATVFHSRVCRRFAKSWERSGCRHSNERFGKAFARTDCGDDDPFCKFPKTTHVFRIPPTSMLADRDHPWLVRSAKPQFPPPHPGLLSGLTMASSAAALLYSI